MDKSKPIVGVVMGSRSDWDTMSRAVDALDTLGIPNEVRVISAHRAPDLCIEYASTAEERGLEVIITGAGGAAHLGGVMAAKTVIPVLGVPMQAWSLDGLDSLLSIVQMPKGIPVGTVAIGKDGAINSALFAASILSITNHKIRKNLNLWRNKQTRSVKTKPR